MALLAKSCRSSALITLHCLMDTHAYAFTGCFPMFRGRIVSDVFFCSPQENNVNAVQVRALWDTGCSHSLVSKRVADFLDLPQGAPIQYRSPFGGTALCPMASAKIAIVLGAARLTLDVGVTDHPNSDPDCDVTLGLDFISMGDFAITHDGFQLMFSFCYPPIGVPTDFSVLAPKISPDKVCTEKVEINEHDAIESRRRSLVVLDYFQHATNAGK